MIFKINESENGHLVSVEMSTDGSCLGNPGPGAWAVMLTYTDAGRSTRRRANFKSAKLHGPVGSSNVAKAYARAPGGTGFGALTTSSEVCVCSAARDKQSLCSGKSHNKYLYTMHFARRKSSITILTITWRAHK